jgi:hypothetical protein
LDPAYESPVFQEEIGSNVYQIASKTHALRNFLISESYQRFKKTQSNKTERKSAQGNVSMKIIIISASIFAANCVAAQPDQGRLSGEYRYHGATLVDPPPGERQDTHLGLMLEGNAARDLYRHMTVKAEKDLCLDDGSLSKTQDAIHCVELANQAGWRCEFAIRLDTQNLVADGAC